ncbi:MAG: hypothetical protein ACOCXJ_03245, partial [Planctomycetota bacterium]
LHACLQALLQRCLGATRAGGGMRVELRESRRDLTVRIHCRPSALRSVLQEAGDPAVAGPETGGAASGPDYLPVRDQGLEEELFGDAYTTVQRHEGRLLLDATATDGVTLDLALPKLL